MNILASFYIYVKIQDTKYYNMPYNIDIIVSTKCCHRL